MQQLKTNVVIQIPEEYILIDKVELEEIKQRAEPEWVTGLNWLSEQTGIKSTVTLREKILYPFRDELEEFVNYPEVKNEHWSFNTFHMKYWLRNNFERVMAK